MYPGLIQPTVNSLRPGATSPRDDAYLSQIEMNNTQNNANKLGGATNAVPVPQFQLLYKPTGGVNPNSITAETSKNSMQSNAWSVDDSKAATLNGGTRRRRKKGGNPNWKWGCYSGGKRRRTNRKTRKHKRTTKKGRRH